MPDEFTRSADRAESLVVKIIRQPICAERPREIKRPLCFLAGEIANHQIEPIAAEIGRTIRMIDPSQMLERVGRVADRCGGAVEDREILNRQGMPVFEPAIRNASASQVPAPANQVYSLERPQPALGQSVKGVSTVSGRGDERQFFDSKVFRLTFELHCRGERE